MADVHMIEERRPEKLRGRDRRSLNLSEANGCRVEEDRRRCFASVEDT